ncbi:glycoside hydrolase family 15 protein [Ferrimicrobium sp.]|uniref:glycoside hydrolase family 15 protein n=1 Tax=Ferrimicrobium sp. TaxID=2926050 RepID=UPI002639CC69|nr:glycoside hydrolase family 15 protein [Ferrimicrobium sp.]
MSLGLEQCGLIGDLHTGAVVSNEGAVEWLCVPRFDSDACFARLLGDDGNGFFQIAPDTPTFRSEQVYEKGTLVLSTTFSTQTGSVRLLDFMPIREEHARIVRIVQGLDGYVDMKATLSLRFDYGVAIPWVRHIERGLSFVLGPNAVLLESGVELEGKDMMSVGQFRVREGEEMDFVLVFYGSTEKIPRQVRPREELTRTRAFWRGWIAEAKEDYGHYDAAVRRSMITLKALTYAPTGGMVAALTTALPEQIGGSRNWDYRYCWLRDATFALYGFLQRGHPVEARAWRSWLLRAIAGSADQLQIMYGVAGERRIPELELDWLKGYRDSRPVRIGNAASGQFQLDVYGEVADVLYQMLNHGIKPDENAWEIQRYLTDHVVSVWEQPDDGIWEIRGDRQHFTYSKIMAWVAIDRGIRTLDLLGYDGPRTLWDRERTRLAERILSEGYSEKLGSFVQAFGSERLDASVLLAPIMGFIDAKDPRMVSTVDRIQKDLSADGFILRYQPDAGVDGIDEPEGVFLPCSFWLVENLAMQGKVDEAEEMLEKLIGVANPLGIYSEEYDPTQRQMLGNFAQAFTHVGLVNAVQRVVHARQHAHELKP